MTPTEDRLAEHERRLDDHDQVLRDISTSLNGLLARIDSAKRYALIIGVAMASGSKGGSSVIDGLLKALGS